jgi:hypothetical protein
MPAVIWNTTWNGSDTRALRGPFLCLLIGVTIRESSRWWSPDRHPMRYCMNTGGGGAPTTHHQTMTFTLSREELTATFKINGEYVEITEQTRQEIKVRVMECYNEWHGLCRFTGEVKTQIVTGSRWTEVTKTKARQRWAEMIGQGWQPA